MLMDFPCSSAGKESACNAGDLGSIPGFGRSLGEGKGYPLQYSGLENSMDYTVLGGRKESHMTEQLSMSMAYHGRYTIFLKTKAINHQRITYQSSINGHRTFFTITIFFRETA